VSTHEQLTQFPRYFEEISKSKRFISIHANTEFIWDLETSQIIFENSGSSKIGNFHPQEDSIVVSGESTCQVLALPSLEILQTFYVAAGSKCLFSPDGGYLASYGGVDKQIIIWDYLGGEKLRAFEFSMANFSSRVTARFSPDGQYIMAGEYDRGFEIWEIDADELVYGHDNNETTCYFPKFIPNSSLMYFSCDLDSQFDDITRVYDFDIGDLVMTLNNNIAHIETESRRLVTSPAQSYLGYVDVWDYESWEKIYSQYISESVRDVSLISGLLMLPFDDNRVSFVDLESGNEVFSIEDLEGELGGADVSAHGDLIYISFWPDSTQVWGIP